MRVVRNANITVVVWKVCDGCRMCCWAECAAHNALGALVGELRTSLVGGCNFSTVARIPTPPTRSLIARLLLVLMLTHGFVNHMVRKLRAYMLCLE